jgi:hypothetical protein
MGILSALFMEFAESSNVSKLEGLKLNEEKMICHIMHSKNHSKLAKEYFIHGYFRVKTLVTSKSVASNLETFDDSANSINNADN